MTLARIRSVLAGFLAIVAFMLLVPFATAQAATNHYIENRANFGVSVRCIGCSWTNLPPGYFTNAYQIDAAFGWQVIYQSRATGAFYRTPCGGWATIGNPINIIGRDASKCV